MTRLQMARWGVLLLMASAVASAYLTRHCLAVANTTMQAELGFNNEQFGYLYSAFSLGYLLFQVPGGWLGQRLGTRATIPLLSLLWSGATAGTALVASLPAMVAARFGFGVAQAGLIPNQAKVLADWFPAEQRGTASAAIIMAMSVGSIVSMALTSWLMRFYDWRMVFHAYSLVGVGWAVLFWLTFRSRPADVPWLRDELSLSAATPTGSTRVPLSRFLGSLSLWALATHLLFKAAGYNFIVTFFPAFMEYAYSMSKAEAGTMATWSLAGMVIGSSLGGPLIDLLHRRTGSKRLSRCGTGLAAMLLTAVLMALAPLTATAGQFAAVMAAAALATGLANSSPWAAVMDIGGKNTAVAMGFLNVGAALAGILITPAVGRLIDHLKATQGDWSQVITLHAAFYLAASLCWLAVNPDRSLDPAETTHAV